MTFFYHTQLNVIKKKTGFTLVETLIAILILSFISIFTAISLRDSLNQKQKLQKKIDHSAQVQLALNLISKDLSSFYNPSYPYVDALKNAEQKRRTRLKQLIQSQRGKNPPFKINSSFRPPIIPSIKHQHGLKGEENSIHFSIFKHINPQSNIHKQSPSQEVNYYLEECRDSDKCLWRRNSGVVDKDLDEGGIAMVLLKNVKEFNIFYYPKKLDDIPKRDWSFTKKNISTISNNPSRNQAPNYVKVELTVKNKQTDSEETYFILRKLATTP